MTKGGSIGLTMASLFYMIFWEIFQTLVRDLINVMSAELGLLIQLIHRSIISHILMKDLINVMFVRRVLNGHIIYKDT